MNLSEINATFDRDKIVLDGLEPIAKEHVTDAAVDAALNAASAYTRRHMRLLLQSGSGDPEQLNRERMRYAIAAGMLVAARSNTE